MAGAQAGETTVMLRFLADENFDNRFLRALVRKDSDIDVIRVQDTEIYQADDPTVLEWAAREQRVLLTHDVSTMTRYAYDRTRSGLPMPGRGQPSTSHRSCLPTRACRPSCALSSRIFLSNLQRHSIPHRQ